MAALWTLVLTALLLSAGTTLADVDQDWLTSTLEGITNEYALGDSFSLAVNVPLNQDPNNLQEILQYDPADKVQEALSEGQVYRGTAVIAAAQAGALSRVLDNIQPLIQSSEGHFLILYSKEPPCGPTCTSNVNDAANAAKIEDITQRWSGNVFVFSGDSDVLPEDMSQVADEEAGEDTSLVPTAATDEAELIPQGLDTGTSLGDTGSTGVSGGSRKGGKNKGGVKRRKGRKKGGKRRKRGKKGGKRRKRGKKGGKRGKRGKKGGKRGKKHKGRSKKGRKGRRGRRGGRGR